MAGKSSASGESLFGRPPSAALSSLPARDIQKLTPTIISVTTAMVMVASTLISGLTPSRTFENTTIGRCSIRARSEARDHQIVPGERERQQPAGQDGREK